MGEAFEERVLISASTLSVAHSVWLFFYWCSSSSTIPGHLEIILSHSNLGFQEVRNITGAVPCTHSYGVSVGGPHSESICLENLV